MKKLNLKLLLLITTLAIGVTCIGFATRASANAMYDASSYLSLTLTDVRSVSGYDLSCDDWSVYYENYWTASDTFTDGDGNATYDYTPDNSGYMSIGDTVSLSTIATGSTGLGIAESYVEAWLDTYAYNYFDYDIDFTFSFSYDLYAKVDSITGLPGDDALAFAQVDILDDFFSVDVLEDVTADLLSWPLVDEQTYSGSFSFTLLPYVEGYDPDSNYISAISYSSGNAVGAAPAPVPEPATMMLLGMGIASLGATRLRKKFK
jgi:hypothetical protein